MLCCTRAFLFVGCLNLELKQISRKYLVALSTNRATSLAELFSEQIEHVDVDSYRLLHEPANTVGVRRHSNDRLTAVNAYFYLLVLGCGSLLDRDVLLKSHFRK